MITLGRGTALDFRDDNYEIEINATGRTERYWNDTKLFLDQETKPHCVGYAWTHWLNAAPIVNYLNPDGIYFFAKYLDEWQGEDYDGTSVRAGAKVLQKFGLIENYYWAWDLGTLQYALLEKGPVVIGIDWYEGFMFPDKDGNIYLKGKLLGGHATVLTGINMKKGYCRGKNSFGKSWGKDGRYLISFEILEKLFNDDGEICIATERKSCMP